MGIYSISDLAELTGIKTHTLRVWEKRYGLLKPQRTDSNIRFYQDNDLNALRLILNLYNHGVKISRIAEMSLEEMEMESKELSAAHADEDRIFQSLVDLDVTNVDTLLENSIRKFGFESTLVKIILPMLERMELMWLSGNIGEAHEACFRELIKRKTIREIDTLPHYCQGPRVIMFLPHGNDQELRHLFMHYFLRKQGLCVTDMGGDISLTCASYALRKCSADCVLIVNADPAHWQFGPFVKELVRNTSLPVVISGRASEDDLNQYDGQVIILDTVEDTIRFVSRLEENLQNYMS